MLRNTQKYTAVLAVSLSLCACANMSKKDTGVLAGGVIGGAIGSQLGGGSGRALATIGGAAVGAFLGGSIGASMDRTDRLAMSRALENTRTNKAYAWTNPDTHNRYTVRPTRTYYEKMGSSRRPCRKFVTTATVAGRAEKITGNACRQPDGSWKIS